MAIPNEDIHWQSFHFDSVTSTMDAALKIIKSPIATEFPFYVSCDQQTSGRGRYNREWSSPVGNLYTTYALRIDDKSQLPFFPYLVALSVHQCVKAMLEDTSVSSTLKWPNDILIEGKKCGGILLEAHHDLATDQNSQTAPANDNTPTILLIGVGVNIVDHPDDLSYPATKIDSFAPLKVSVNHLSAQIAQALSYWRNRLIVDGFEPIRKEWLTHRDHRHKNMSIRVRTQDTPLEGTFHDINRDGQLELLTVSNHGQPIIKTINSGDTFFL